MTRHLLLCIIIALLAIFSLATEQGFDETIDVPTHLPYVLLLTPLLEDCKAQRLSEIMAFVNNPKYMDTYPNISHKELTADAQKICTLYFFDSAEERDNYTVSGANKTSEELLVLLQEAIAAKEAGIVHEEVYSIEVEHMKVEEIEHILKKHHILRKE